MKNLRALVTTTVLLFGFVMHTAPAQAQDAQSCQPGLGAEYVQRQAQYDTLIGALGPHFAGLVTEFTAMTNQATYQTLLTHSQQAANSIANGRILIALPDGTVVIDTSKANNTYANFQAKLINENHNSRLAIFAAQSYPCGLGLERKLSSTTNQTEAYVAIRAGDHLSSVGTIRISSLAL